MLRSFWRKRAADFGAVATLAAWRWRQQWFLLLITGVGVLAATTLICSIPLFSSVMITAGLRNTLSASPANAQIEAHMGMAGLSSTAIDAATRQLSSRFTQDLASYVDTTGDLSAQIEIPHWLVEGNADQVILHGAPMRDAASHAQILQGHFPVDSNMTLVNDNLLLDVALTQSAATYLKVQIGSEINVIGEAKTLPVNDNEEPQISSETVILRVVGIFQTNPGDAYWHGLTFQEPAPPPHANPMPFTVLVSSTPLLQWIDSLAQRYQTRGISFGVSSTCSLTYTLNLARLSDTRLDDLITRLQQLQADIAHMQSPPTSSYELSGAAFPYLSGVNISGATLHDPLGPELLDTFQNEVLLGQATMLILTLQIVCLILFFISMLAHVQVESQESTLALLRSRGASRGQILATFGLQGLLLCLLASCAAPVLASGVARLCAPLFLPSSSQDALNVLPSTLSELLNKMGLYSLLALIIALGTQLLAFFTALRGTILTLRRESARSTRRPLWLRLRLDLLLAVVAGAGYGFSLYTQATGQLLDNQSRQLLLTPLSLLAPLIMLLACILFFLRLYPIFLRFFLRILAARRGAPSMLAVAQIARAPRQSLRLILLLALALAFVIFTLVFASSQNQHAQDLAAYQAGADFSGYLPLNLQSTSQAQIADRYRSITGVISVSPGYAGQADIQVNAGSPDAFFRPLQVRAIDPQTFGQTATWTPQTSAQPLNDLLAQLAAQRPQALQRGVVPAILSTSAWNTLDLHPGAIFSVFTTDGTSDPIRYLAVAEVAHIPPANESVESGMLVDLQALQVASQKAHEALPTNYIWLHTSADPSELAGVRRALSSAPLALASLNDRQALTQANAGNPLILNLLAILSIGVSSALLLAVLANLVLPILSMRARLTGFAFLRALGAAPSHILRLLIWEQGLVLLTALLLGTLTGLPLAMIAVPALIVNSVPVAGTQQGANAVFLLQGLLPARIVLPPALLLALAALLILFVLALLLVSRIALRLTLGQQLRLNED